MVLTPNVVVCISQGIIDDASSLSEGAFTSNLEVICKSPLSSFNDKGSIRADRSLGPGTKPGSTLYCERANPAALNILLPDSRAFCLRPACSRRGNSAGKGRCI